MTTQGEVQIYLKESGKTVTIKELAEHFGIDRRNMTKKIKKMNQFSLVDIEIDGRTYMVKAPPDVK